MGDVCPYCPYGTIDLINDLRNEIQIYSEELAQIFPKRLVNHRGNAFGNRDLSRLWAENDFFIAYQKKSAKKNSNYIINKNALSKLKKKLENWLSAKALGCYHFIQLYQNNKIGIIQFIDLLEKEIGRVSGEIAVTNEELSLILAGTHEFIKGILKRMRQPSNPDYNPHYKFSKERLEEFRNSLYEIFGIRAKKCFDLIKRYESLNDDLKEYSKQQYTITKPHYFKDIENNIEASYWFGFLRADGSRAGDPHKITFSLARKDIGVLTKFATSIGFPLNRIEFLTTFRRHRGLLKRYEMARVQFACRSMARDIDDLGFQGVKVKQKKLPTYVLRAVRKAKDSNENTSIEWWETLSGKVALAFLLGFYDGDGSYAGGKSASIVANSKQYLEEIKEIFDIKNKLLTVRESGDKMWIFGRKIVSTGLYSLALGPKLFNMMLSSYYDSMKRKRPH